MSIDFERFEIADAIITGAGLEIIAKRQRAQSRVTAGAAAVDDGAIRIDIAARGEKLRTVDTIVNIPDSPRTAQTLTIGAAIPGAAAVIDIKHGYPAAGPVLNR